MEQKIYDTVIIGGGPAGYTAALYAVRAGLDTLVLERFSAGGQMTETQMIDNYPGFDEGIDGFSLGERMQKGATRFGAVTEMTEVQSVDLRADPKRIVTDAGERLAKTVIIATGAGHKHLGLSDEERMIGRGVAYCAVCDGMFYRQKTVAVVGGGNSAAADALFLSRLCKKVYVIHRRDALRATKIYHDPLMQAENVEFVWNSRVTALSGDARVDGVVVENVKTGDTARLDVDGVFISIGRSPASALFEGQLELDPFGYIVADESTRTSLAGVFAVGDVRTKEVRQVVTAAADGAVAAHYAELYLTDRASM